MKSAASKETKESRQPRAAEESGSGSSSCPVCLSTDYQVDRRRGGLDFGHCRECGLAYVRPLAADDDPTVAGSQSIRTWDEYNRQMLATHRLRAVAARPLARQRLFFYEKVMGRKPRSILDIGCGDGSFCEAFRELGLEWSGVDINPETVTFAQQQGLPVVLGDFTQMEESGAQYDVLFASQVVEHCLNPHEFLRKARAVLAPDGLLHIDVPNHAGLIPGLRKLNPRSPHYGFLQPPYHLLAYTAPVMRRLLEANQFEPVVCGAFENSHPVFGQVQIGSSWTHRALFKATGLLNRGSLLVAVARPSA